MEFYQKIPFNFLVNADFECVSERPSNNFIGKRNF